MSVSNANPYAIWGERIPNYPAPSLEPRTWLIITPEMRSGRPAQYGQAPAQYPDQFVTAVPVTVRGGTHGASPRSQTGTGLPRGQDVSGYYLALVPPRTPTAGDPRSF